MKKFMFETIGAVGALVIFVYVLITTLPNTHNVPTATYKPGEHVILKSSMDEVIITRVNGRSSRGITYQVSTLQNIKICCPNEDEIQALNNEN